MKKVQIIDDDSIFNEGCVATLTQELSRFANQDYKVMCIIGAQSTGKSTLLNALFNTNFEVMNRMQCASQTTKGVWACVDPQTSTFVVDVEGSDSNQRRNQQSLERRHSLFALALSHVLLINLWVNQVGLHKGAQFSILQIIFQINLRLFQSEQPKNIVFVVRDCSQQENYEQIKKQLLQAVHEVWKRIQKPKRKQQIQLKDLFILNAFFLPSKLEEKELFFSQTEKLKNYLLQSISKQTLSHNVPARDFLDYMRSIWNKVDKNKDINLPQEKIMMSNFKCEQIKTQCLEEHARGHRITLEQAERKITPEFGQAMEKALIKLLEQYDQMTQPYLKEEVAKVRQKMIKEFQDKVERAFKCQAEIIEKEYIIQFVSEVETTFLKSKNFDQLKEVEKKTLEQHKICLQNTTYKIEWVPPMLKQFKHALVTKFKQIKERIIQNSLKQFDTWMRKTIQSAISQSLENRQIFTNKFSQFLCQKQKQIVAKAKNAIIKLYSRLGASNNAALTNHIKNSQNTAQQQMHTILKLKTNNLLQYSMRHFSSEFNLKADNTPRIWNELKQEQISQLYKQLSAKYLQLLDRFCTWDCLKEKSEQYGRQSMLMRISDELLSAKDLIGLKRDVKAKMELEREEAMAKHTEKYSGSVPGWGWALALIAVADDIYFWVTSSSFALPFTIILILVAGGLWIGGKPLIAHIKQIMQGTVNNAIGKIAANVLNKKS